MPRTFPRPRWRARPSSRPVTGPVELAGEQSGARQGDRPGRRPGSSASRVASFRAWASSCSAVVRSPCSTAIQPQAHSAPEPLRARFAPGQRPLQPMPALTQRRRAEPVHGQPAGEVDAGTGLARPRSGRIPGPRAGSACSTRIRFSAGPNAGSSAVAPGQGLARSGTNRAPLPQLLRLAVFREQPRAVRAQRVQPGVPHHRTVSAGSEDQLRPPARSAGHVIAGHGPVGADLLGTVQVEVSRRTPTPASPRVPAPARRTGVSALQATVRVQRPVPSRGPQPAR